MRTIIVRCLCLLTLLAAGSLLAGEPAGQKLREELIRSADRCMEVFQDGKADPVLRRTAFRFLLESPRAEEVLNAGMKDPDAVIRCRAIYELFLRQGVNAYSQLKAAAAEETVAEESVSEPAMTAAAAVEAMKASQSVYAAADDGIRERC